MRFIRAGLAALLALAGLAWAANAYRMVGISLVNEQLIGIAVGTVLALTYLTYPARRNTVRTRIPFHDWVLAAAGLSAGWYVAIMFPEFQVKGLDAILGGGWFNRPPDLVVVAAVLFPLILEAIRRVIGYAVVIIVLAAVAYAMVGHLAPGSMATRNVRFVHLLYAIVNETSGLLGFVVFIGCTIVIAFVFFSQLLIHSGGATFFQEISLALMGRFRGGAAKISILGSSLFGSITGIVISNIAATGVITIKLMKDTGFKPRVAAAVEATASTGGQLMPPVMGIVAFVMADFLGRRYADIVIAAIVPSLLYFVSLFIQADLEAAKEGIKRVDEKLIPSVRSVLKTGWIFVIPFAVLIYALFWMNLRPDESALMAAISVIVVGLGIGYKGERMKLRRIWDAVIETGLTALNVIVIIAGAGFLIGTLDYSGLSSALTQTLAALGRDNLVALLVIISILSIVLGMGMPTLIVYIMLAALMAPALVKVGIQPIAAHMFILYFGMMSFVTPPVAIGAFFAAALAKSEPMATGFTSMRFSWTAYIVPFLFVFSPHLLLQGDYQQREEALAASLAIATAIAGVWLVSVGMIGFFNRRVPWPVRGAFVVCGVLLLLPADLAPILWWTDYVGGGLGVLVAAYEIIAGRRHQKAQEDAAAAIAD